MYKSNRGRLVELAKTTPAVESVETLSGTLHGVSADWKTIPHFEKHPGDASGAVYCGGFFSTFAQVSRKLTVRLNTMVPDAESLSAQKYPSRSN